MDRLVVVVETLSGEILGGKVVLGEEVQCACGGDDFVTKALTCTWSRDINTNKHSAVRVRVLLVEFMVGAQNK